MNCIADYLYERTKLMKITEDQFLLEREIQKLTEINLQEIFGLDLVKNEFELHDLRIDTLAFDKKSNAFVMIEYNKDRNFFVIDQGVSYLNIMHNKADFVLEYNKRSTHQLKRKDVDWSQSPIIFFSSALMKNQQYPRGFKDLGIELWEVHKYTNSLIGFDELKTFI